MNGKQIFILAKYNRDKVKRIEQRIDRWAKEHGLYWKITHCRVDQNNNYVTGEQFAKYLKTKEGTVARLINDKNDTERYIGTANCSPKDNYDRLVGRVIAKIRAKKMWHLFNKCP